MSAEFYSVDWGSEPHEDYSSNIQHVPEWVFRDAILFPNNTERDTYSRERLVVVHRGLEAKALLTEIAPDDASRDDDPEVCHLRSQMEEGRKARFDIVQANKGIVRRLLFGAPWRETSIQTRGLQNQINETPSLDNEDLYIEGLLALYGKIPQWDPEQASLFGYTKATIHMSLQRTLDKGRMVRLPAHINQPRRAPEQFHRIQYGSGWITEEEREALELFKATETGYFSYREDRDENLDEEWLRDAAPLTPDVGSSAIIVDDSTIDDMLERRSAIQELVRAKDYVSEREWHILSLRYGLDQGCMRTYEEVGELMGLTRSRIQQIEVAALEKISANVVTERYPSTERTILQHPRSVTGESKPINKSVRKEITRPATVKIPTHEGINIYLDALRVFRAKHADDNRYVSFKVFFAEVGIPLNPFFSSIHVHADLIEPEGERASPLSMQLHDGSVTALGAEKIVQAATGTTHHVPTQSVAKLLDYISRSGVAAEKTGVADHLTHESATPERESEPDYAAIGRMVVEKGLILIDPVSRTIIDPNL